MIYTLHKLSEVLGQTEGEPVDYICDAIYYSTSTKVFCEVV